MNHAIVCSVRNGKGTEAAEMTARPWGLTSNRKDCRPEFLDAARTAVELATEGRVTLAAPFIQMTKSQIVEIGAALKVPFELTYSCYNGGEKHCGLCGTCTERIEAFYNAHVEDPTEYVAGAKEQALIMLRNAHKI